MFASQFILVLESKFDVVPMTLWRSYSERLGLVVFHVYALYENFLISNLSLNNFNTPILKLNFNKFVSVYVLFISYYSGF